KEVGAAEPAGHSEGGLEDDGRAAVHGGAGLLNLVRPRSRRRYFDQTWRASPQLIQVSAFPGVSRPLKEQKGRILFGSSERLVQVEQIKGGEVAACQMVDHIACGESEHLSRSKHRGFLRPPDHVESTVGAAGLNS